MKECFKCHRVLPLAEFYKHKAMKDGHLGKCKECSKSDVRKNYEANRDYYIEYEHRRAKLPHRVAARDAYRKTERGREVTREINKRWQFSEHGKKKRAEMVLRYRIENPEKRRAHSAVNNAIRDGKLFRRPCEICGDARSHAHHHDYSKPLDVRWLCSQHHHDAHRESKKETRNERSKATTAN